MMRGAERKLEKKRKNEGGSNWEKLREWEKKRNCPFDAKKVCPVTSDYLLFATFLVTHEDAKAYMYSLSSKRRVHKWKDIRVNLYI